MLSVFQARFQRLETALNTLVESVAAYNPSVSAADALVAADEDLEESLGQLAVHHANYARILELRATADALDEKIKSTLRTLADTRKELLDIPSSQLAKNTRQVGVEELLSYAKFISKTTVPPTFRGHISTELLSKPQPVTADVPTTQITNGMATPAANGDNTSSSDQPEQTENRAVATLSAETKAMLDPLSQLPFVPWPSQDVIRMGALATIQGMIEDGTDPTTVLSAEEQEARDKQRQEEEERLQAEQEERERRRREDWAARGGGGRAAMTEDVFDPDEL
ncbi:hypothetical protein D6D22_07790 [Aureobasidium pullulans]|uniref:Mediator of RNA polymerase II transcription subunit 4 n=1 Tax=Aureobasidium pullulans TaxID=5580 RepID=A0A4S8X9R2_AURPU|nr:hypothetical protein D6D22_07790 [Aureobasidium pullulans]THX76022.1 hypothetical protein D6D04_07042 [Aureobasidium pullulans]